jgi:CRP/FNR family transcriptional activator FtrB
MADIPTQVLKRVRLFEPLPEACLAEVAAIAQRRHLEAGNVLFHEGSDPEFVHALVDGGVVLLSEICGQESVIEFFGSGDSILLPAVLLGSAYPASARMTTGGDVIALPARAFLKLASQDASLSMQCARSVSRQWGVLLNQVKQIKTQGAAERLAHFLLSQVSATMGPASLTLPGMKKQVATRLGIKPETFSRTLRKLRAFGVEANGDLIRIRSVERLASLVKPQDGHRA